MGKVLIQVGASEEARAAMRAGVPSGKTLVLPRSNVPEDLAPKEEQKPAAEDKAEKADAEKESKPEVNSAACLGFSLQDIGSSADFGSSRCER